ncbi:MAG TPA: hypothetical protein VF516_22795 [Kofleriaceae bacterium]
MSCALWITTSRQNRAIAGSRWQMPVARCATQLGVFVEQVNTGAAARQALTACWLSAVVPAPLSRLQVRPAAAVLVMLLIFLFTVFALFH